MEEQSVIQLDISVTTVVKKNGVEHSISLNEEIFFLVLNFFYIGCPAKARVLCLLPIAVERRD